MVAKSAVIHLYVQYGSLEAKGLALAAVVILIVSSSSGITTTSPRPDGKDGEKETDTGSGGENISLHHIQGGATCH